MTTAEIIIVKKSWKLFRGIDPEIVGDTFYSKLFADTPKLRNMFPKDMHAQYEKLMNMLNMIVQRLHALDEISDEVAAIGHRHKSYGVKPAHYRLVGTALLWTLEKGLGKDWNEELKTAWVSCYDTLAKSMMKESPG